MGVIILLRHGQASFGAADYDALSDLGRAQAVVAGRELARRGLRDPLVVTGTLRRQRDTATIAMDRMGVSGEPRTDGRWDEYDHVGMVAAEVGADPAVMGDPTRFQAVLDDALAAWVHADAEGGWRDFSAGATAALADLAADLGAGRDAVVSTSGGVIAAVCGHLLGVGPQGIVALNRVTVNAGLTTLIVGASGTNLLSFNDHAHLSGEHAHLRTYR